MAFGIHFICKNNRKYCFDYSNQKIFIHKQKTDCNPTEKIAVLCFVIYLPSSNERQMNVAPRDSASSLDFSIFSLPITSTTVI